MEASEMSAPGPVERIRKTRIFLWSIVTLTILSAASAAMFHQWADAQLRYRECFTDREQVQVRTKDLVGTIADLFRTSPIPPDQQEQLLDRMSALRDAQDNAGARCDLLSLGGSLKLLSLDSNAFAQVTPVPAFSQDSVRLVIVVVISAVIAIYFLMCVYAAILATDPGKLKFAEYSFKTLAGFGTGVLMSFLGFGH